jgi:hypothetical protein
MSEGQVSSHSFEGTHGFIVVSGLLGNGVESKAAISVEFNGNLETNTQKIPQREFEMLFQATIGFNVLVIWETQN